MLRRLIRNWVYGGFLAGLLRLALTALLARDWQVWLTAVWMMLPRYMLHQYEEHDNDRLRASANVSKLLPRPLTQSKQLSKLVETP